MLVDHVRRFLERHHIGPCRLVAACSGGVDSTALLLALCDLREAGFEIVCAHVNHHLRGEESDADEHFVRRLCSRMDVPIDVRDGTLDPEAVRRSGIEAAARDVRHQRLQEVRAGDGVIATAHQKNDQAETVVMRLITGTGLAGLRGIHEVRDDGVIRPLIETTRDEIVSFLAERGVTPQTDRMNEDRRFLRTRVRTALRDLGAAAIENIAGIAAQARQLWPHVEQAIDRAEGTHVRVAAGEVRFRTWPDDVWMRQALLLRHIRRLDTASRDVSARDLERLATSVDSIQRVSVTGSLELIRRRGALVLRRLPEPTGEFELNVAAGESVYIPQIHATMTIRRHPSASHDQQFQLPPDAAPTFTIRNRRRGDRFQPLGMSVHKKLKDFLIDRKIAAEFRDRIPLLVWNGEIVWVAGVEISDRFKVTGTAAELFEVVLDHESREDQNGLQF